MERAMNAPKENAYRYEFEKPLAELEHRLQEARKAFDRTKRPEGKPAPKIQLPQIQKEKLSNGLNVWLVEHHELPMVAMNLVIQAGSDHDPLSQPGLASMTADMLDEETTTRSTLQIS